MDKIYESIPAFCPRIDIVGVTHYSLVKYLSVLFNLLMQNIYTLKDSFDQNEKNNNILRMIRYSNEYMFV